MEAAGVSETSVSFQIPTRRHNPEDIDINHQTLTGRNCEMKDTEI
jgi:hypothetical protein